MAVVRFSEELKEAIVTNAKALFEKQITAQQKAVPNVVNDVVAQAYSTFMPQVSALPRDLFKWVQDAEVVVKHPKGGSITISGNLSNTYPKPEGTLKTPCGAVIKGYYRVEVTISNNETYAEYVNQVVAWHDSVKAIEVQRDEFVAGVKKVINAHSTLAPALKAWPPLWDLVPESYKERHRKVVERSKQEAVELDVDLTKLTTTVVTAKITGK